MAQLAGRREASILDGDDDGMSSVESGANLAGTGVTQSRASRAARNKIAFNEARELQSGPCPL